jgi:hypothetical protein
MSHPLLQTGARFRKIDLTLDYQTILLNEPRPVHLIATLSAPKLVGAQPSAFGSVCGRT